MGARFGERPFCRITLHTTLGSASTDILGSQTAAHGSELLLGKGHLAAATLARYLDEAGLRPCSDLSRKPNSVTHLLFLITRAF